MSLPFPPVSSTVAQGDAKSVSSSLLTPPQTPLVEHDAPFRPCDDDRISLNMRKRRRKPKINTKHSRRCVKGEECACEQNDNGMHGSSFKLPKHPNGRHRTKSLGFPQHHGSGSRSPHSAHQERRWTGRVERCERRWTLPSKSEATRGHTPVKFTVKLATPYKDAESPAIITLRRATTNRVSKRTELTFFPEPVFSYERSGLLSYLVSTFGRKESIREENAKLMEEHCERFDSRLSSSNTANRTTTIPAPTICTETTIDADLTMPGDVFGKNSRRRCSTKFVSAGNTYEIIWDGKDSITTSGGSSRPSPIVERRTSLAVSKLEAQLAQSAEASRRQSEAFAGSPRETSVSSVNAMAERMLTISKLETIIPRLLHKTGLTDLPRSRIGRQRKATLCSVTLEEEITHLQLGNGTRQCSVSGLEIFPPLASRKASVSMSLPGQNGFYAQKRISEEDASPRQDQQLSGSMIGSSGHRRRSSAYTSISMGFFKHPFGRKSPFDTGSRFSEDQEGRPLLCTSTD